MFYLVLFLLPGLIGPVAFFGAISMGPIWVLMLIAIFVLLALVGTELGSWSAVERRIQHEDMCDLQLAYGRLEVFDAQDVADFAASCFKDVRVPKGPHVRVKVQLTGWT